MKRILLDSLAVLVLLLAVCCNGDNSSESGAVEVSATVPAPYCWHPGDVLYWYEGNLSARSQALTADNISSDGKQATFDITLPEGSSREGFFASGWKPGDIVEYAASVRQDVAGELSPAGAFLHSGMGTIRAGSGGQTVTMQAAGSLLCILTYTEEFADEAVTSVSVSSDYSITGKVTYDHKASSYVGMTAPSGNEVSVTLKTPFPLKGVSSASQSKAVYVPLPATGGRNASAVKALEGVEILVTTDKASYSFSEPSIKSVAQNAVVDLALKLDSQHRVAASGVYGIVQDTEGKPFVGAVVSDGVQSVATDVNGRYNFEPSAGIKFIQCSVPSDAAIVKEGKYNIPCSYYQVYDAGKREYNFTYKRQASENTFRILCLGDPQTKSATRTDLLKSETVTDINSFIKSHSGDTFYAITAGDNVENKWDMLPDIANVYGLINAPVFPTIGNHDHEYPTSGEPEARAKYEAVFGPSNYSFNRGDVHIVVIDDIIHDGQASSSYKEGLEQGVVDWVGTDLRSVPTDKFVLVSLHAPLSKSYPLATSLTKLLKPYGNSLIIAGHTHNIQNERDIDGIHQCAVGSCGAPWKGLILSDGCVRGYKVYTFTGNRITDEIYKCLGHPEDHQLRMYHTNDFPAFNSGSYVQEFAVYGDDYVAVNCFNYKSSWKIEAYEDGVRTSSAVTQKKSCDVWARKYMNIDYEVDSDSGVNTHMLFYKMVNKDCKNLKIVAKDEWGHTYQVDKFTGADDFTEARRK